MKWNEDLVVHYVEMSDHSRILRLFIFPKSSLNQSKGGINSKFNSLASSNVFFAPVNSSIVITGALIPHEIETQGEKSWIHKRIQSAENFIFDSANESSSYWENPPVFSFDFKSIFLRARMYTGYVFLRLLQNRSWSEKFLLSLPISDKFSCSSVVGYFPDPLTSSVHESQLWSKVNEAIEQSIQFHSRMLIGSVLMLPVSSVGMFLPGPNVFLMWNFFRLYSHWKAQKNAQSLKQYLGLSSTVKTMLHDERLRVILKEVSQLPFGLEKTHIRKQQIKAIGEKYDIPEINSLI